MENFCTLLTQSLKSKLIEESTESHLEVAILANFQDFEKSTKTIETLNKSTVEANQTRLLIGATKVDPRLTKDERAKEIKRLEESLEVLEGTVDSSRKSLAKMFKEFI